MLEKIKAVAGSIRFWIATLAWGSDYLALVASEGFTLETLFAQIAYWLTTVVGLGTIDGVIEKYSKAKNQVQ